MMSAAGWGQAAAGAANGPNADIVKGFQKRVKQYMDTRTQQAGKSPKPTSSSAKLAESRQQMAQRTQAARSGTQPGNIFTPAIANYFRRQIAATLSGPQGARVRSSLRHAEPHKGFVPKVNEKYPEGVPLQSTPPTLLLNLPDLPKELQYRIVGNDLVLLDTAPNIIVDFIRNVIPTS